MATNVVNFTWNTLHDGNRVPVNDTDVDGAPAALGSHDPLWEQGSINRAVKAMWDINGGVVDAEDQADYDAGIMDIPKCNKYIFSDHLYGYKGDMKDQLPGDMMSFRAYPTPVVLTQELVIEIPNSNIDWNPDGTTGIIAGEYIIAKYSLTLTKKLTYDVEFEVEYNEGGTIPTRYDLKIEAGSLNPTHYKLQTEPTVWTPLLDGFVYFSTYSAGFSGDKTMTATSSNWVQVPYYGTLGAVSQVVTEAEYDNVTPAPYYYSTTAYKSPLIFVDCTVNTCSEYPESSIKSSGITSPIYLATGDTLQVGKTLYTDTQGTKLPSGTYCNAVYVNNIPVYGNIYRVTRIFIVDGNGVLTTYHSSIFWTPGCWSSNGCGRTF